MNAYGGGLGKPVNSALMTIGVLLMAAALFLLILGIRQRRKAWLVALMAIHFAWDFYLVFCLMDARLVIAMVSVTKWVLDCPVWALGLMEGLSFAAIVLTSIDSAHYAKTYLWHESVKQAIDALPVGICVGKGNKIYLVNVRMNEFCVAAFGGAPDTADGLWAKVEEVGEQEGERRLVHGGGKTLMFGNSTVEIGGTAYRQVVASDVTEQYRITRELQTKHDKLKEVQLKALEVRYQTEELAKNKELLEARVRVHDEIGHILLLGKYYFEHDDQDAGALIGAIKTSSNLLMGVENAMEGQVDPYQEAVKWAEAIGLGVELVGDVPQESVPRKVVAQAIRECATNAVKHADATEMKVEIEVDAEQTAVRITNNGKPPKGDIVLSGGLRSLQKAVEEVDGQMKPESAPCFILTIILPQ